ncbi:MAG: lysophospholipid acyltransferase family protein [Pseudobdellovibrionaceae bacterium]
MINFFGKPNQKIFGLKDLDKDTLLYRVMPHLMMEILRKYFRLQVEGAENIPKKGAAMITPNHSGYSGFDAMILSHQIYTLSKRIPRVMTHHFWFLTETTALPAQKLGFVEASTENGMNLLKKNNLVVLFPEGEAGNFKPTHEAYALKEFKRGFVRMALRNQCPIVPVVIIGAEETHINLSQLKFTKYLRGTIIPLPLNIIPLPVKWRIRFLPPIYLPYKPEAADDAELVHEIAADVRGRMQQAIKEELKKRDSVFF